MDNEDHLHEKVIVYTLFSNVPLSEGRCCHKRQEKKTHTNQRATKNAILYILKRFVSWCSHRNTHEGLPSVILAWVNIHLLKLSSWLGRDDCRPIQNKNSFDGEKMGLAQCINLLI
jgi:hypothetical protein